MFFSWSLGHAKNADKRFEWYNWSTFEKRLIFHEKYRVADRNMPKKKELFQKFFLENWHLRSMHRVIISNFLGYNLSKFLVWEPKIFQYLYRQNIRPFLMPDQVYLSILLSIFFPRPRDHEKNISFPNNQIWAHKFKVLFFLISETSYVYWLFNAFKLRFSLVDLISSFQVDSSTLCQNFNPI